MHLADRSTTPKIPQQNNMDILRLGFASMVVFAHCYDLSQNPSLAFLKTLISSELAVQGFFILSGFLIVMSYENASSLSSYASKRARRIYPAYFAVVVIPAILGIFLTSVPLSSYLGMDTLKYLISNLLFVNFLRPDLPGIFQENAFHAVNGALWTIKIEVSFYIFVPMMCWAARRFGKVPTLASLFILSVAYIYVLDYLYAATGRGIFDLLAKQLPGQLTYFLVGAALYYYFRLARQHGSACLVAGIFLYALSHYFLTDVIRPIGLGLMVFSFAFGPYLGNATRHGDFSYGIYICHFPIVQTLVAYGLFDRAPFASAALAYGLAALSAVLSWHLIEKKWLSKSSHYMQGSSGKADPVRENPEEKTA